MPFFVATSDLSGNIQSGTIAQLSPGPGSVSYPDKFVNTVRFSKDGSPIVQSPNKDGRTRIWIWRRYSSTFAKYTSLYNQLLQFQYKLRQANGLSPWIYLKDTETGNLTYRQWNGTTWVESSDWVRVKVIQVAQTVANQGGPVKYDETKFEFYIDDPRWNLF